MPYMSKASRSYQSAAGRPLTGRDGGVLVGLHLERDPQVLVIDSRW
jgi:hypothetical protein